MKKLIILLLIFLASSVIGQSNNEKYSRDTREIDLFMQQTGRSSQLPTLTTRLSWLDEFISLYSEYEAECNNDSTLVKILSLIDTYSAPYVNREPTLKGFIEYLRKKLNQKRGEK